MFDDGLYRLYRKQYGDDGEDQGKNLSARFLVHGGKFVRLEDHDGALGHNMPSGDMTVQHLRQLARLSTSGHYQLVDEADVGAGEHPEHLPDLDVGMSIPEASFWITGGSLSRPIRMDVHGETVILDGTPLEQDQAKEIEQRISSGELVLQEIKSIDPEDMQKSENGHAFQKAHGEFMQQLEGLRSQGVLSPDHYNSLAVPAMEKHRRYFMDSRTPNLGNQEAFDMFRQTHGNHGTHVSIDGNDFGLVNKHLGMEAGDQAIADYGKVFHDASQLHSNAKGFRKGGDEFHFWFDKPEHAAEFVRNVRENLENSPRIGGIFNKAVSMGIGPSYDQSERALEQSKWQMGMPEPGTGKRLNAHMFGNAPITIHNSMTGESYRTPDHVSQRGMPTDEFIQSKSAAYKIRQTKPMGAPAQGMTKSEGVLGMSHPHGYNWHDGHTDHHGTLAKEEPVAPGAHPHNDAGVPGNDQNAGVGVSSYAKFAAPYGKVTPGKPSNLMHYDYRPFEGKIDALTKKHGFQVYTAGGKYGKPDLGQRNYNTGHLMIYDPTPGGGGDSGDEAYTRSWRKIHELSHALTLQDLNQKYGEGRRLGKLGVRTPREAKRAVEWEWLAAHKQRELSNEIGHNIPDDVFHRELNTVMHDAVHRAVTGQFTEPSGEGYEPHAHKVPLGHALGMVDQEAQNMGLQHDEDTLKAHKQLAKAAPVLQVPQPVYPIDIPNHPMTQGGHFGVMSGQKPRYPVTQHGENAALEKELALRGLQYERVKGRYGGGDEDSYVIHRPTQELMRDLGKRYGQESVIYSKDRNHQLIYTNGANEGQYHPATTPDVVVHNQPQQDYYTVLPTGHHATLQFNFNQLRPVSS